MPAEYCLLKNRLIGESAFGEHAIDAPLQFPDLFGDGELLVEDVDHDGVIGDEGAGSAGKQADDPGEDQGLLGIGIVLNGDKVRSNGDGAEKDAPCHIPAAPQGRDKEIGKKPDDSQGAQVPLPGGYAVHADKGGHGNKEDHEPNVAELGPTQQNEPTHRDQCKPQQEAFEKDTTFLVIYARFHWSVFLSEEVEHGQEKDKKADPDKLPAAEYGFREGTHL
jgi:hypothetical protein